MVMESVKMNGVVETTTIRIAMLIPVCSRHQTYRSVDDVPLLHIFLPNFLRTKEERGFVYKLYVGYDDDDDLYRRYHAEMEERVRPHVEMEMRMLAGCQHNPVAAWNALFEMAVKDGHDYFFQIGDDVGLETMGWTRRFVRRLERQDNLGTVAPCEPMNYLGRLQLGKPIVNGRTLCIERTTTSLATSFIHPFVIGIATIGSPLCMDRTMPTWTSTCGVPIKSKEVDTTSTTSVHS
jgi:hypothetical protein